MADADQLVKALDELISADRIDEAWETYIHDPAAPQDRAAIGGAYSAAVSGYIAGWISENIDTPLKQAFLRDRVLLRRLVASDLRPQLTRWLLLLGGLVLISMAIFLGAITRMSPEAAFAAGIVPVLVFAVGQMGFQRSETFIKHLRGKRRNADQHLKALEKTLAAVRDGYVENTDNPVFESFPKNALNFARCLAVWSLIQSVAGRIGALRLYAANLYGDDLTNLRTRIHISSYYSLLVVLAGVVVGFGLLTQGTMLDRTYDVTFGNTGMGAISGARLSILVFAGALGLSVLWFGHRFLSGWRKERQMLIEALNKVLADDVAGRFIALDPVPGLMRQYLKLLAALTDRGVVRQRRTNSATNAARKEFMLRRDARMTWLTPPPMALNDQLERRLPRGVWQP